MRYRLITVLSYLPESVQMWLYRHTGDDESVGGVPWNIWMDANYAQYVRREQRRSLTS